MVYELMNICRRYNWFTHGTSTQYERLFEMVRCGRPVKDLVLVIFICSDGYLESQISSILEKEGFVTRYRVYRRG